MKKLPLLLSSTLLLTACSKTVKEIHEAPQSTISPVLETNDDLKQIRALIHSKNPNIALAELLAYSVAAEHRAELKQIVESLDANEAKSLIAYVEKQNESIRQQALFHGQDYQNNQKFLGKIINNEIQVNIPTPIEQLKLSVFGYVRNKAVNEILKTYHTRSTELANEISLVIASDIGENHPLLAKKIEAVKGSNPAEQIKELILKSEPVLKKVDEYFRSSELSKDEQYALMITGLVAGGIYTQLEKNGDFKKIIKEAKKVYKDFTELKEKAKEVQALVKTISDHVTSSKKDFADFKDGLNGSIKDMHTAFQNHAGKPDIQSRRMIEFLTNNVIKGKKSERDSDNIAVTSEGAKINANIEKTINATANMTNNLSTILQSTKSIMDALKMKPSKDLQKVIDGATKVAQVASLVQGAVKGYLTGGPMGIVSALSGSSALGSLLGGGGGDSAKLDEISRKLDQVLKNQQEIMRLQHVTINLLKDMALMIDDYHKKEMEALTEIRAIGLTGAEVAKFSLNQDFNRCEALIHSQLKMSSTINNEYDYIRNIYNLKLNQVDFKKSFSSFPKFSNITTTLGEDNLKDCYKGVNNAFDGRNVAENPIRAIFSFKEEQNAYLFEQEKYQPNLKILKELTQKENLSSLPLHFPVSDVDALASKTAYFDKTYKPSGGSKDVYQLDHLISTVTLERYVTGLLILHPVLELDSSTWKKSFKDIVDTFIEQTEFTSRSNRAIKNALKMTQSAIAQEAIIAGEPILHKLHENYKDYLSAKVCQGDQCVLRKNKLLMKNLVMYTLRDHKTISDDLINRYERFYQDKDFAQLSELFISDLTNENFEEKDGSIYLKVLSDRTNQGSPLPEMIRLPTPEELKLGRILYTENMPRLIYMQTMIINELQKVTPIQRTYRDYDLSNLVLLSGQEY